tara:strand:- start:71 stop:481 length:411 start_codon:yes stop_codon:yes gene_type:complete
MGGPHLRRGIDQILGSMDGDGVIATQPMNLILKEIKDSIPSRPSLAHRTGVQWEGGSAHLKTEGDSMTLEDGCLNFMNHLTTCADIDVFGRGAFVIVSVERLLDPCLARAFEPSFQAARRPDRSLNGGTKRSKAMA